MEPPSEIPSPLPFDLTLPPDMHPNIDHLITEDDTPVDNLFVEILQVLLTEPLHSSWKGGDPPRPILAVANVGLFANVREQAIVPDVMIGRDVQPGDDLFVKQNRSWMIWVIGKAPEVVVEIVLDRRGGELGFKQKQYAWIGVAYYVVFDPQNYLGEGELQAFELRGGEYERLEKPYLPKVGLGLTRWEGMYRGAKANWLRWTDRHGNLIPTGEERANQAEQQAERLREKLRALGVDPES